MDKHTLEQYADLRAEERDLVERIHKTESQLRKLEQEGIVADSVTRGKRGKKSLGTVKIQGFPTPEYDRLRSLLINRKVQLQYMDVKLLELLNQVEDYINSIEDSRMRRILRYRYIDGLMWYQVAQRMGRGHTGESCRKAIERFLKMEK